MRSSTSPTLWSWKIPRTSTTFPPTARCKSAISPATSIEQPSKTRLTLRLPKHNRKNMRKREGEWEVAAPGESRDNRGGMRGRRRRRGRRGERMPESKFASPAAETPREAPRTERPERSERPERNGLEYGLNSRNEGGDQSAQRGRNGRSVPNTGRRRDISPSFCPENPSQNINGWPRPGPRLRAKGLRLRHLTSPQRPSRRFFPTMSRFLLPQIQRNRRLRLAQKRRRTFTGSGLRTVQALGTANSSAFTR